MKEQFYLMIFLIWYQCSSLDYQKDLDYFTRFKFYCQVYQNDVTVTDLYLTYILWLKPYILKIQEEVYYTAYCCFQEHYFHDKTYIFN